MENIYVQSWALFMSLNVGTQQAVGTAAVLQDPVSGAQYSSNRPVLGVMGRKNKTESRCS